jgi:hypothetical protein
MALTKKIADPNWYIVSYLGIHSDLVGGLRCARLKDFLIEKTSNVRLITSVKNSSEENHIGITDPIGSKGVATKILSAFSPLDSTIFWGVKVAHFLRKQEASILFTSLPPFGVLLVGLLLKRKGHFWIADFRDPWTINHLYRPIFLPYKLFFAEMFEKFIFRHANLILLNTDTDKTNYNNKYPNAKNKTLTIRNGFDQRVDNIHLSSEDKKITLVYAGGVYSGGIAAIDIAKLLLQINKKKKRFFCDFYGEHHSILDQSEFINYKGRFQVEEVPFILSQYSIGLIYLQKECIEGGRINQKFYDYLGSAVQPIVINPSLEMKKQMRELDIGLIVSTDYNPQDVVQKINQMYFSRKEIKKEKLIPYQRKYQFEILYNHLLNNQNIQIS